LLSILGLQEIQPMKMGPTEQQFLQQLQQQQPAIAHNMYGMPPNGLPGVAAANYQGLLLLSQSQSGNNSNANGNNNSNGNNNANGNNNNNGNNNTNTNGNGNNNMNHQHNNIQGAMPPQQINNHINNSNNNMMPQGSMPPQQMWMNHPVLAQALGLNFYQKGSDEAANMQNNAGMAGFTMPGGLMHSMQVPLDPNMTGRSPTIIYMSCDDDSLSEYQCLVRKQIELFEARREDVDSNAQGRNRPIVMGQVGIRCRHCTMLPPKHRARGAIYYPAKLYGLYQAAQNMASSHLCEHCQHVPPEARAELLKLRDRKSSAGGGKKYWADGVRILGVFEDEDGLRYEKR
jgi:hypothetical protein